MTDMRAVPKPEGYDLRVARSQKTNDLPGSLWLPEDALFSAFEMMKEQPPRGAFIVCWYTPNTDDGNKGRLKLKFQGYQQHDCQMKALAAEMAAWLVAP
jgi:hypothetical protein